ncbi:MAG: hypothetical protein LBO69_09045 [Ignavibacteria bacterium]|jgi:hypothetical protein|nr:hypothetical protein [Ignavibacteria bacterium]
MANIPANAKKIKINFICDVCSVDVPIEIDVPASGTTKTSAVCPVCFKSFEIIVGDGKVIVSDFDDDITVEAI